LLIVPVPLLCPDIALRCLDTLTPEVQFFFSPKMCFLLLFLLSSGCFFLCALFAAFNLLFLFHFILFIYVFVVSFLYSFFIFNTVAGHKP